MNNKKKIILLPNALTYKIELKSISKIPILYDYLKCRKEVSFNKLVGWSVDTKYILFIISYSKLYPDYITETKAPETYFYDRVINSLLSKEEGVLFNKLLDNHTLAEQLSILIKIGDLADKLGMNILFDKVSAIFAMLIKDEQIIDIKNAMKSIE